MTNSQNGSQPTQGESSWQNEFLKEQLHKGVVRVKFVKKDGSIRDMQCTLKADLLPAQTDIEESVQKKTPNPAVLAVYDVENNGWRSFRWDSIIGFTEA